MFEQGRKKTGGKRKGYVSAANRFKEYWIANPESRTKMIEKIKPELTKGSASVTGTRVLQNPVFQNEIRTILEGQGVTDEVLSEALLRNIKGKRDSVSNGAIDITNRMKGNYAPEKKEVVKLNLTGKELNDAIQGQIELLKELQAHTSPLESR